MNLARLLIILAALLAVIALFLCIFGSSSSGNVQTEIGLTAGSALSLSVAALL